MKREIYDLNSRIELSSYYELREIAEYFYVKSKELNEKETTNKARSFFAATISFSTFMFEAYMNYSSYYVGFDWNDDEKLSTLEKFEQICNKLELEIDFGKEPFQTVKTLCSKNFRDSMVHGKTYRIDNKITKNVKDLDSEINRIREKGYLSKKLIWTRHLNKNYALKAYDDVMVINFMIYNVLCPEIPIEEYMHFSKNTKFPRALCMGFPTCPIEHVATAIIKDEIEGVGTSKKIKNG